MKTFRPLIRLLWRPGVVWDLFVTSLFAVILSYATGFLGRALFGDAPEQSAALAWRLGEGLHFALLGGGVVGLVSSFAMQDLLYCRLAWLQPGLRGDLRRGLAALALLSALVVAAIASIRSGGTSFASAAICAVAGFGLGNQFWDPHPRRWPCFLAQIALVLIATAAIPLAPLVAAHPLVGAAFAIALTAGAIWRSTTKAGARARALLPAERLGVSFHSPENVTPYRLSNLERRAPRRAWRGGSISDDESRTRALLHENSGWLRWEWKWMVLRIALPSCCSPAPSSYSSAGCATGAGP